MKWTEATVVIPDVMGPYLAEVASERWNGWACPRFSLAVVQQMVRDTAALAEKHSPGEITTVVIEDGRIFLREYGYTFHQEEVLPVDGKYPVGAWAWCWETV